MSIKVAISACLIGQAVRYDGSHKYAPFINQALQDQVQWLPLCPEVAIGMGTPRPPIQLVSLNHEVIVRQVHGAKRNVSQELDNYAHSIAELMQDVHGYIFMQKSPSCGLQQVKLFNHQDQLIGHTQGRYSAKLSELYPHLPMAEEASLQTPQALENFIAQVLAYGRWQQTFAKSISKRQLLDFHARHKYLLMAHEPASYQQLGGLLANLKHSCLTELAQRYRSILTKALKRMPSRGLHSNVLQHLQGYLKQHLSGEQKAKLTELIQQYQHGHVPFRQPYQCLRQHIQCLPLDPEQRDYLLAQSYLNLHPLQLQLRDHF